jgi:putative addiction module killer protein
MLIWSRVSLQTVAALSGSGLWPWISLFAPRVQGRIMRFESGNLGDHKSVGGDVLEARMPFGPGYRTYFGKDGTKLIVLLVGGDKSTQTKDIKLTRQYWNEYLQEVGHGKTK